MSSKRRPTAADYEDMAASYAAEPVRPEEVRSVTVGPGLLRMGRPTKDTASSGKSPALSTRYPAELREQITTQAETEGISESELVRKAVAEYITRRHFTTPLPGVDSATWHEEHAGQFWRCFPHRVDAALATRDALIFLANHHTEFEVKVTANPTIVETKGTLNLDDFVDHIAIPAS